MCKFANQSSTEPSNQPVMWLYNSKLTVPFAPSTVAIHLNRLSLSGKADIPGSPDVCKEI